MRLNFSGVSESDIHEGIRRIGEIVREQVGLYGTLTGVAPVTRSGHPPPALEPQPRASEDELAKVLQLPAQRQQAG
jgi:2-aminoadipate transaminase